MDPSLSETLAKPSLLARIAIAKAVGLLIGLVGFFASPLVYPGIELYTRIGILLWYPTMGAVIALFGVMNWHPVLHMPLPWWFRSTLTGAWMNLVLVFFAHEPMTEVLARVVGQGTSPFWYVVPGGLIGCLIGFITTRFAGEGPETVAKVTRHA